MVKMVEKPQKIQKAKKIPAKYQREEKLSLITQLQEKRIAFGMGVAVASRFIGVSKSMLRYWEQGRTLPTQKSIARIKAFLADAVG